MSSNKLKEISKKTSQQAALIEQCKLIAAAINNIVFILEDRFGLQGTNSDINDSEIHSLHKRRR